MIHSETTLFKIDQGTIHSKILINWLTEKSVRARRPRDRRVLVALIGKQEDHSPNNVNLIQIRSQTGKQDQMIPSLPSEITI